MADINVDDDWFLSDPRRTKLIGLVGDEYRADGMALAAWRIARRYWKDGRQPIPLEIWELAGLDPLVDVKLAVRKSDGIHVYGTEKRCAYLASKAEAGHLGGLKSAEARLEKYGSSQPVVRSKSKAKSKQDEAGLSDLKQSKHSEAFTLLCCTLDKTDELPNGNSTPTSPEVSGGGSAPTEFDTRTAEAWLEWARTITPGIRAKPGDWATAIRRMREIDKLSEVEITALFTFVQEDSFWRTNALSPVSLREQKSKNNLRKIENVRLAMERAGVSTSGKSSLDIFMAELEAKGGPK